MNMKKSGKNRKKEVCKIDSKSQTFSMDILVALVIFIVGLIIFLYLMMGNNSKGVNERMASDADALPQRLIASDQFSTSNTTFVIDNKVDIAKLNQTLNKTYEQLKRELGITSDFCIHFEDENGNILDLDEHPCKVRYSIGNPSLNITIEKDGVTEIWRCGATETIPDCNS
jgi:hypothetical protein